MDFGDTSKGYANAEEFDEVRGDVRGRRRSVRPGETSTGVDEGRRGAGELVGLKGGASNARQAQARAWELAGLQRLSGEPREASMRHTEASQGFCDGR